MKQHEVTQKTISGNRFYIRPFPAFKCAYISGEVFAVISPLAASLLPVAAEAFGGNEANALDADIATAMPALAGGLSAVSGDKVEGILRKLLVQYRNVSVELDGESEAVILTEDIANEVFCGDLQDMLLLAFEVIKVNFPVIFKKLGDQFGKAFGGLLKKIPTSESTEPLT